MSQEGNKSSSTRRLKAYIGPLGTTQIHLRNPYIIAWWSMAFPGFGHLLLSKYLRAYVLFIWEVFINYEAHINLAIIYSFTGRFSMSKEILNKEWLLLYIPTYIFAIWDSYRTTVDINNNYILASREDAEVDIFKINTVEINYLDKRTPWASLLWSAFSPGIGQLYIHRIISSFYILIWWIIIIYFSKFLPALHYTLIGEYDRGLLVLNPQWFLNIPSIYFFSMYDAYIKTIEDNKLFDWEQSKFFNKNYQDCLFNMPINFNTNRGEGMYVISTFEHSIYLETAITAIQMRGVPKEAIMVVPLDKRNEERKLFDTTHHSDGLSLLDIPLVLATAFTVLGNIYGFVLKWGPIIWGIIGAFVGLSLGLIIRLYITKKFSNKQNKKIGSEVVIIIECKDNQLDMVKEILWEHNALGVRKLILGADSNKDTLRASRN